MIVQRRHRSDAAARLWATSNRDQRSRATVHRSGFVLVGHRPDRCRKSERIEGQRGLLLPITGKKAKEAAGKAAERSSVSQNKELADLSAD